MPSRRYYTTTLPVEHLNGKLAPVDTVVHNTADLSELVQDGFLYGYKIRGRQTSRFGIRKRARNLNSNPYTPAEDENRTLFAASLQEVYAHKQIASDWALMLVDFDKQQRYISPIGYAVAATRDNQGVWPERWSH